MRSSASPSCGLDVYGMIEKVWSGWIALPKKEVFGYREENGAWGAVYGFVGSY
jgi:hypothetical protein